MADQLNVLSASGLLITGKGQLTGFMISTSAVSGTATFYDNTAGSGTKIVEVIVSTGHPAIVFLSDAFSPRFATGLYLALAASMTATVWSRKTG
jgi:hypothetical protein